MAILKNLSFANKALVTQWGKLLFDAEGKTKVDDEAGKKLSTLKGFSVDLDSDMEESSYSEENPQETKDTTPENEENEVQEQEDVSDSEEAETESEIVDYTENELGEKNVPQLKKIAKELGIKTASDAKKQQLIEAILENQ